MPLQLVISDPTRVKTIKTELESIGAFVKPIRSDPQGRIIVRTNETSPSELERRFPGETIEQYEDAIEVKKGAPTSQDLMSFTAWYFTEVCPVGRAQLEQMLDCTPSKYSVYPPVLLLNNSTKRTFQHEVFTGVPNMPVFYDALLEFMGLGILALNKPIDENDEVRKPDNLQVLHCLRGKTYNEDEVWCQLKQNGIWQVWNPFHTMFSRGNVKEKKRILDTFSDVAGHDVIDLYCGIGYFSFSYLRLGCRYLFGFDLNPWSIDGLHRGLTLNDYFSRDPAHLSWFVYNETNEASIGRIAEVRQRLQLGLLRVRHINLGLLPSSEQGWPVSVSILRTHHDWAACPTVSLHIHENVHIGSLTDGTFTERVLRRLTDLAELPGDQQQHSWQFTAKRLERIKTFAPDVWHVCLDVDVEQKRNGQGKQQ
ncbi:tRNA(Phe) (4-demethylwyosine(37)-C(7)) aminocarboxypropyltransferase KNAG_0H01920 [Huiozyma naganishii CBS 8797]|uniref:tRNA wybutosine-synthesizing protein 2 n=1 Tax=Huiozyma naganishii (strain ATCC MYA-139 / BCRC 22969 / CBS 8797 / KCTC 17520 / NBRC 10181 / NCYC 3082 / Yp74L-3) TaxID=1071383 RepID=J7S9N5_HUIN7|nr:hypothetical protein KNAG_0H01920 [Kazachstania naganishii CBS 8797]CCK71606.1 hypothetical protein KNAG_0H01920 [Kazachstania naganishii CBS 8797]